VKMVGEMPSYEAVGCRKPAALTHGNNVDIVGVPSSILGTPTILSKAFSGIYIVAGRFDKPEGRYFASMERE